ncbi:MAG: protein-S-isoprenylcysteine O-methyltransferase, partial [Pseudomonadota bacterium]
LLSSFIRMPFNERNKSNEITVDKKTTQEKILLTCMFLSMGIIPVLYLATKGTAFDVLAFANYNLPLGLTVTGALLVPAFAYLFWRSHYDLGRNWSATLEMREDHNLVTNGVYKRVRHPMYSAIWIAAIAQPLLIHNLIGGALVVLAFGAMCILRIPQEEEMMISNFGEEYRDYMARTGRIFPKLS